MKTKVFVLDCGLLSDEKEFNLWCEKMPPWRKEKISAAKAQDDKRLSLGAGILLEYTLKEYDTASVSFSADGKPFLPSCPLFFSISHSGDMAVR